MAKITRLEDARRTRDATGDWPQRTEPLEGRTRRYRLRAEELRTIAEDLAFEETRLTLLNLAGSYERMALMLEGLASEGDMA
jgi:hypothetical protein